MRILLSTYGSRGDVEPMAALATALQALGAEAVVSAPADLEFLQLADRAGVELAPAFSPVREWIEAAKRAPKSIPEYGAIMIGAQHEAIMEAAAGCDAILATGLMPSVGAAQAVAEIQGLAYGHVSLCPLFLPSHHHAPVEYPGHPNPPDVTDPRELWALNAEVMRSLFGGTINAHRASVGLPAIDDVREHVFTRRPFLASDPVLWPWRATDLCEPVQTGAWILSDARSLPADLDAFLNDGPPPVYVGFGSIALPSTREAARVAIQAIRSEGRRIVLARGWADNVPIDDGEDCFLIGEVNQQALFSRVAAVIHHGGAGTTTAAGRAGAPQVIVPQIADQPYWAARVAGLGIGAAHDGAIPTVESLTAALETALAPESRRRAKVAAARMPADGAAVAARILIEKVGSR